MTPRRDHSLDSHHNASNAYTFCKEWELSKSSNLGSYFGIWHGSIISGLAKSWKGMFGDYLFKRNLNEWMKYLSVGKKHNYKNLPEKLIRAHFSFQWTRHS